MKEMRAEIVELQAGRKRDHAKLRELTARFDDLEVEVSDKLEAMRSVVQQERDAANADPSAVKAALEEDDADLPF